MKVKVKVTQLFPTLCDPMDYTVHGSLQARILERVAIPLSRGSSQPRDRPQVSCIAGRFFTSQGSSRILEWVVYPLFSGSSWPRNLTRVSCIVGGFFTNRAIREAQVSIHMGGLLSLECLWRWPGSFIRPATLLGNHTAYLFIMNHTGFCKCAFPPIFLFGGTYKSIILKCPGQLCTLPEKHLSCKFHYECCLLSQVALIYLYWIRPLCLLIITVRGVYLL